MTKRVTFEGRTYEFPDDATDAEISEALGREPPARPTGVGSQYATGVMEGVAAGVGHVRDERSITDNVGAWIASRTYNPDWATPEVRARYGDELTEEEAHDMIARARGRIPGDQTMENIRTWGEPSSEQVNRAIESVPGVDYAGPPRNAVESGARTLGQFTPGAAFPGGVVTRAARVVVPAATSETAGQVAREVAPDLEQGARFVGGLAGGVVTEGALSAAARPRTPRATGPAPDPEEFLPRTQGERTGNTTAIQRENELRRTRSTDAGGDTNRVPEQAQRTLRDFDDARAEVLQDNMMRRVATRGRDPNTESAGDAGVVVADDLRSGLEAMEAEQAARYARARELAGSQQVAPTDELAANVARVVEEQFLDAGPSVAVINRLNGQIRAGNATYQTVETARQALNRQLGTAMRSGDDAQSYAIRRIIDELDAFVEPRLTGDAQTAIREARGYTREMMNLYGEQARPELSTGHTGRTDRGGRVIRDIIESEMTGDQVIDSIFGANGARPTRSALGVVRRIHDRATRSISTNNYEAPTGAPGQQQRAAGRETLRGGRSTRGGREFNPTEAQRARFGNEAISDPALQSLREAFIYRLGRRLSERSQGDAIPARQMANDLRTALDGAGSEITPLLFNPEEVTLLRRLLADLESVAPPRGTYNPSAPGVAQAAAERSFAAIAGRLLGRLPVVGPAIGTAIEEGLVNARAIRDARNAVRQPGATPPPSQRPVTSRPNAAVPFIDGMMGAPSRGPDSDIDTSRPALENSDGSYSTERTITVEADGKYYVIPTIVGGRQLSEDDAIQAWQRGENQAVREPFDSLEQAEAYARFRSARIPAARQAAGAQRY